MEKDVIRHEGLLENHEIRIRSLEVNQAVLTDHVKTIRKWSGWGLATLGGIFVVQLANLLLGG